MATHTTATTRTRRLPAGLQLHVGTHGAGGVLEAAAWLAGEAREACREHAQDNPAEVYEWWRVSSWLCAKLNDIGEVTIDNEYGYWWGRTCTGQGLIMDGTLQTIAAQFVK